ncbi:putative disease resistance RPP13-like protein 1, partial [Mucuna pruriens]
MHDFLKDLAKYISGDICYRLGVDDKAKCISERTRHFSFPMNHVQYFDGFASLFDVKRLCTFMPISTEMDCFFGWNCEMWVQELFSKFKFLRVLSLSSCSGLTEVPDFVGNLKHLCSLDLSYTDIKKLPDSMCSLYNLQILKLKYCINLEELPSNLEKLTNLRCLEFIGTKVRKMPMHLGKLKNLQELSTFCVCKSSETVNIAYICLPFEVCHFSSKFNGIVSIHTNFYGNSTSSFTSLKILEFSDMQEWEEWECKAVTGAFPCLQHLSIWKCPNIYSFLNVNNLWLLPHVSINLYIKPARLGRGNGTKHGSIIFKAPSNGTKLGRIIFKTPKSISKP